MGGQSSRASLEANLSRLLSQRIGPEEAVFWGDLLRAPVSQDIWSQLLTLDFLRSVRVKQRRNFETLARKVSEVILLYADHGVLTEREQTHIYNALIIFSRLMPIVFEDPDTSLENNIFWNIHCVQHNDASGVDDEIEDTSVSNPRSTPELTNDDENDEGQAETFEDASSLLHEKRPMAMKVMEGLSNLLFSAGFTICWEYSVLNKTIWNQQNPNIETTIPESYMYESRILVVKALLACLVEILHKDSGPSSRSRWVAFFSTSTSIPQNDILHSFLNVGVTYDAIGWNIPYFGKMVEDHHIALARLSLDTLLALLYQPVYNSPTIYSALITPEKEPRNLSAFNHFMSEEWTEAQMAVFMEKTNKILSDFVRAKEAFLPSSLKCIEFLPDVLVTLWSILSKNQEYLEFFIKQSSLTTFLSHLMHILHIHLHTKDQAYCSQVVECCVLIIVFLSTSESFCQKLEKSVDERPLIKMPVFYGNFADFITILYLQELHHQIIPPSLKRSMLVTLVNISIFAKIESMAAVSIITDNFGKLLKAYGPHNVADSEYICLISEIVVNQIATFPQESIPFLRSLFAHQKPIEEVASTINERTRIVDPSSVVIQENQETFQLSQNSPPTLEDDANTNNESTAPTEKDKKSDFVHFLFIHEILTHFKEPFVTIARENSPYEMEKEMDKYVQQSPIPSAIPRPMPVPKLRKFNQTANVNQIFGKYTWEIITASNFVLVPVKHPSVA